MDELLARLLSRGHRGMVLGMDRIQAALAYARGNLVMAAVLIAGLMILRIPKAAPRISASQIVRPAPVNS